MEQQDIDNFKGKGRMTTGFFLILAGTLLLASKLGAPLPRWIFSWPVILIAVGLFLGIRHNFRNPASLILIIIGGINLIDRMYPELNFHNFIAPVIIILIGLVFVFRPAGGLFANRKKWDEANIDAPHKSVQFTKGEKSNEEGDYIDSISVFGGVKKIILSKNFKGGEITCFMGGAEINLSQADMQGPTALDVTQVFGGTKIIVPAHWYIKTEVITVFGGIEDKRPLVAANMDLNKLLIIRGTSVFGGIDIRSY
jgi:predicted membrane protein